MSNPTNPGRRNRNSNNEGRSRRPVKWTYLELGGLALAFFLIIWPVMTLVTDTMFPRNTAKAAPNLIVTKTSNKAPSNNALPGDTVIFTITAKNSSGVTNLLTDLTDTVPNPGAGIWNGPCNATASSSVAGNTPPAPSNTGGYAISLPPTSIDIGEIITLTITCQVKSTIASQLTITNVATGDLLINNDSPSATASVPLTIQTGVSPTNTPVATNTPLPTNTPAATNTPLPTNTSAPTSTPAPTNTSAPAPTNTSAPSGGGGGGGGGGGNSPTNTPLPYGTVNAATVTAVIKSLLTPGTSTPLSGATPTPPASPTPQSGGATTPTSTAQPPVIPPQVSGVISGAFSSSTGSLAGTQVALISRTSGGADQTIKTTLIDSSNQYFFSSVPATAAGQVYFVRFSNSDPGSGVLRLFNTNAFSFAGGNYRVATADVTDVRTGPPGAGNNSFQLPVTLSWFSRSSEDRYSVTIFKSNTTGPALDSGNLGNATNFTLRTGQITEGSYFAQINILNPLGTGISNREFAFRIVPGIITAPTVTRIAAPQPAQPTTAAPAATTAAPTTAAATATATTAALSGAQQVPLTPSPASTAGTGSTLPSGSNQLPGTGGELPILGLMLAGFTLVMRRFRLVHQSH